MRRGSGSVASEPPRQLDVEDVEVDGAHLLEEPGRPGVGLAEFRTLQDEYEAWRDQLVG